MTTDNWELFDIIHAVLPTRLPLDEFYEEYAGSGERPSTCVCATEGECGPICRWPPP